MFTEGVCVSIISGASEKGFYENQIQALIHEGFGLKREFISSAGQRVRILSIGEWNRGRGPDFLNCRLLINGREKTGDIEVHKSVEEWYEHRHHLDSHYENVRLHITYFSSPGEKVRNSRGNAVSQISLQENLDENQLRMLKEYFEGKVLLSPIAPEAGCNYQWGRAEAATVLNHIEELGFERIYNKAGRYGRRIDTVGYQQTLYEGLLESAGYSRNKIPFLLLAGNLSLNKIRELTRNLRFSERLAVCEAALLGCAGLLSTSSSVFDTEFDIHDSMHFHEIKRVWRKIRGKLITSILSAGTIRNGGNRPNGSPVVSLLALARFFAAYGHENFLELFLNAMRGDLAGNRKKFETLEKLLKVTTAEDEQYGLRPNILKPVYGPQKVNRFIGNILIPVFLNYAWSREDTKLNNLIIDACRRLKASHNKYTRYIYDNFTESFKKEHKLNFLLEQGLIQQYSSYCTFRRCERCSLLFNKKRPHASEAS